MSIIDRLADRSRDPRTLEIDYLYLKDPDQCKSPGTAAGILSLNPSRCLTSRRRFSTRWKRVRDIRRWTLNGWNSSGASSHSFLSWMFLTPPWLR
jgi:hypothetical protein